MRTLLTQDHATNLRDLLLNYELDKVENKVIDFTYGKGSMWKTDYQYKFTLTKCDAVPINGEYKRNIIDDDYGDLGLHDAGVFDPPYLYGHQVFDYSLSQKKPLSMQKMGANSWAFDPRFSKNKNETVFIERVKALNVKALQCLKNDSLLFVKVMDPRHNTGLVLNHLFMVEHLTNFVCHAIFIYYAGGAKTWRNHAELSHGYWMVFKLVKDAKQSQL